MCSVDLPTTPHLSIMLIGPVPPNAFRPAWFAEAGLLSAEHVALAQIATVLPELRNFSMDWLHVTATEEYLNLVTPVPGYERHLADVALGAVRGAVSWKRIMVAQSVHALMPDLDSWDRVGHAMVAKEPWTPLMKSPGTISVTVRGDEMTTSRDGLTSRWNPRSLSPQGFLSV